MRGTRITTRASAGCRTAANMIIATANRAVRWQDIPMFDMLVPFDVLISPYLSFDPHVDKDLGADRFHRVASVLRAHSLSNNC